MRRPLLDLSAQLLPVFAQLFDRAVLTGLLLHRLGIDSFERWSLLLATIAMLTILDLGTQVTFSNRMAMAAAAGNRALAGRIYRESNTIFLGLATVVMICAAAFAFAYPVQQLLGFVDGLSASDRQVALLLGTSTALKMAMSNLIGAYRANLGFAKGTVILTLGEMLRSVAAVAAVLFAPGLLAPALAMAAVTAIVFNLLVPLDVGRRFAEFRYRLAWPTGVTTDRAFHDSAMFAASYLPTIVLTQIPVLIIGGRAASGVLASFLLMRMLTNLLRTFVQRFAGVVGMELARLEVQGRLAESRGVYNQASHFAAYLFGFATACALVWGDVLVRLWTGSDGLFSPLLLALMMAPLVLTPRAQIAAPFVTFSHRPKQLARAIALQTGVAVVLAVALPIDQLSLRFTLAIYGAELVCLPPLLYPAAARALDLPVLLPAVLDLVRACGLGIVTYVFAALLHLYWPGVWGMTVGATLLGLCALPLFYLSVKPLVDRARL